MEEDLEADPDPRGSLSIQRMDSTRAANRWQRIARALASLQGHAKFIDMAPWDFWELWSGSGHLTRAAQDKGLAVGPSVDMLPNSALPCLLLDLMVPADVELLWWLLQEYRPKHVHVAPLAPSGATWGVGLRCAQNKNGDACARKLSIT